MNDDTKVTVLQKMAEVEQQAQQFRRSIDWKLNLSLWAGLVASIYSIKVHNIDFGCCFKIVMVAIVVGFVRLFCKHQRQVLEKNIKNMTNYGEYMDIIQQKLEIKQVIDPEAYKNKWGPKKLVGKQDSDPEANKKECDKMIPFRKFITKTSNGRVVILTTILLAMLILVLLCK